MNPYRTLINALLPDGLDAIIPERWAQQACAAGHPVTADDITTWIEARRTALTTAGVPEAGE